MPEGADSMPYLEVVLVVCLIFLNGLLAMSELAVASSRQARLRTFAERSVRGAKRALALASDPGRFLSTVQIGITLIGILAGVLSGATLGDRRGRLAHRTGPARTYRGTAGLRRGGHRHHVPVADHRRARAETDRVAETRTDRLRGGSGDDRAGRPVGPLVWLLERSGRFVMALLGYARTKASTVDDAEIHELIADAETAGVLEPAERSMIAGVMRLVIARYAP